MNECHLRHKNISRLIYVLLQKLCSVIIRLLLHSRIPLNLSKRLVSHISDMGENQK